MSKSSSIHVTLAGDLDEHVRRQVGKGRPFKDAGDYIRTLVSRDLQSQSEASDWLREQLTDPMHAAEDAFVTATAEDVIRRNVAR